MAVQKAAAAQLEAQAPSAPLGSAGASSNPLVHQLLAERAIMASAAADGEDVKSALKAIDQKLADLGVSAGQ
jgi:hypothetical protein